ncbi:MAG: Na+/H+ antiporter NhaC family protein [Bacillota bacterium]|nr:Na+/H+ antiporter NhaC family protein [Bacillota bacterium]
MGWLSILPPLIAIVLAIITKEVLSSLLVGIVVGILIFTQGNVYEAIKLLGDLIGTSIGGHGSMLLFLGLLGCLVVVVTKAGGSFAYGKWASKRIKSKAGAQIATALLGMLIFIDDYFNCLTVGTVMRPVTDNYKVSRAKLAYLIDSTAAPICIIAPVSSWAASVIACFTDAGVEGGMAMFIKTIPFNLYAILTLIMVFYFCVAKHDIGPMKKHEEVDNSLDAKQQKELDVPVSEKGTVMDLVIPVLALIFFTILFMYLTGYESIKETVENPDLTQIFGNASTNLSLVVGGFLSLLVAFVMYIPRKLLSFKDFMESMFEGVKSMVPAMMILILAWSIGGITQEEYLNTGSFIASLIKGQDVAALLPPIIFLIGAVMSFSTGTAWGTFGILIPILVPIVQSLEITHMYPIIFAAIFSGSIFGDHSSPISDTTILSSAGAGCRHIEHVRTQLPYAITVAVAAFFGFIAGGFTNNVYVTIGVGVAVLLLLIYIQKMLSNKNTSTGKARA